jgi:DNA adenine methylase
MLIPYLGEKTRFASFITPYIPTNISVYAEPFAGMYGVFFALDHSKFKNVKFIYNDLNKLNYLLFNNLKKPEFIDLVKSTKVDEVIYKQSLKSLIVDKDEFSISLDWLVVLCCSHTHEIGKYSYKGDSEFEVFKLKYKAYKYHLDRISEILDLDYKDLIEQYDREDSFFYVDPPYYGREKYYLNHNFTEKSHNELADTLNNIKGKFALSYYWFDGLEDLYPNCKFESKKTIMGTEYLIMNY